ncbi:MAG: RNA polymerase subunit sigma-24 [Acidobacteria bacterium]|nr:MAG: RNA polymerase subunit sigma-24 [Acidobacteriota bacterium]
MNEGQQVVAGPVILSEAMAMAQAGEDVLEAMLREHARLVFRVAYSVLRNHHDAEDATQETFVRVLRYGRKLGEMRDPKTWLARIAWRVAVDRRKKPPEVSLDDSENAILELSSATASADQFVLGSEMSRLLEALIAALPEQLRDPLTLSTVEEMSPDDIAEVLRIKPAAVRSRMFRGREILREKLSALLEGKYGA